jgi:hypothetical protein
MNALSATALIPARAGLAAWMRRAVGMLREIGPYAAIEIVLPGGTLIALTVWLCRRYRVMDKLSSFVLKEKHERPRGIITPHHC